MQKSNAFRRHLDQADVPCLDGKGGIPDRGKQSLMATPTSLPSRIHHAVAIYVAYSLSRHYQKPESGSGR